MAHGDNSAMAQVRLAAAARLAGTHEAGGAGGEAEALLRELNDKYASTAKSIKVTRERTTFEVKGAEDGPVVSQQ